MFPSLVELTYFCCICIWGFFFYVEFVVVSDTDNVSDIVSENVSDMISGTVTVIPSNSSNISGIMHENTSSEPSLDYAYQLFGLAFGILYIARNIELIKFKGITNFKGEFDSLVYSIDINGTIQILIIFECKVSHNVFLDDLNKLQNSAKSLQESAELWLNTLDCKNILSNEKIPDYTSTRVFFSSAIKTIYIFKTNPTDTVLTMSILNQKKIEHGKNVLDNFKEGCEGSSMNLTETDDKKIKITSNVHAILEAICCKTMELLNSGSLECTFVKDGKLTKISCFAQPDFDSPNILTDVLFIDVHVLTLFNCIKLQANSIAHIKDFLLKAAILQSIYNDKINLDDLASKLKLNEKSKATFISKIEEFRRNTTFNFNIVSKNVIDKALHKP